MGRLLVKCSRCSMMMAMSMSLLMNSTANCKCLASNCPKMSFTSWCVNWILMGQAASKRTTLKLCWNGVTSRDLHQEDQIGYSMLCFRSLSDQAADCCNYTTNVSVPFPCTSTYVSVLTSINGTNG